MLADFDREKEHLWFPILQQIGFSSLGITGDGLDQKHAMDACGVDPDDVVKYFALRIRDEGSYSPYRLRQFKQEFTIRYSDPSDVPVEWQKLFEPNRRLFPDFFCYGWFNREHITDYVVLDVRILRYFHQQGYLQQYKANRRRNINSLRSEFVFIPLRDLLQFPDADRLIVYHSENHPVFL
ncbi:hypothetical protein C6499_03530 [Candidatus Poribacteria bacterium]|nr:MAG: hypothetical protein C6499_03530 [Candidatus Poribacteria bacterium]